MSLIPKRLTTLKPSVPVGTSSGRREVKGDIGIEIEMEGNKFPKTEYEGMPAVDPDKIPKGWSYHKDGSLRGQDNAEYVFSKPMKFEQVEPMINELWEMLDDYGTVLDVSNRTSVHVHLNVQPFHLNRLCAFMGLYFVIEDILTAWCGEHRRGNLFCLRAKDAPGIISELKKYFKAGGKYGFSSGMHYAGLNASAINKFGSLEVRTLRGCTDKDDIITWVNVLRRIYDLSAQYPDPRGVCEGFSGQGPIAFLENILGPYYSTIVNGTGMSNQEIMSSMYEGVRLAQDLCYCLDWSSLEYVEVKADPFQRKVSMSDIISMNTTTFILNSSDWETSEPEAAEPDSYIYNGYDEDE